MDLPLMHTKGSAASLGPQARVTGAAENSPWCPPVPGVRAPPQTVLPWAPPALHEPGVGAHGPTVGLGVPGSAAAAAPGSCQRPIPAQGADAARGEQHPAAFQLPSWGTPFIPLLPLSQCWEGSTDPAAFPSGAQHQNLPQPRGNSPLLPLKAAGTCFGSAPSATRTGVTGSQPRPLLKVLMGLTHP